MARARVPKGLTLDALSDGLTPQTCLDAGRCYPPEKVVEDAFEVYFKASETLRRTGTTSQAAVPGCTSELLALVIQQALGLANRVDEHGKKKSAHATSLESVQQKLRASFARALSLREQARRVLAAMARDSAEHVDEVLRAATAADDGGSAAAAMFALSAIGKRLLGDGSPKTAQRAQLLGLDEAYLARLEALGHDLQRGQDQLAQLAQAANTPDDALYSEAGLTVHLMMHVIEAFAAAHESTHRCRSSAPCTRSAWSGGCRVSRPRRRCCPRSGRWLASATRRRRTRRSTSSAAGSVEPGSRRLPARRRPAISS